MVDRVIRVNVDPSGATSGAREARRALMSIGTAGTEAQKGAANLNSELERVGVRAGGASDSIQKVSDAARDSAGRVNVLAAALEKLKAPEAAIKGVTRLTETLEKGMSRANIEVKGGILSTLSIRLANVIAKSIRGIKRLTVAVVDLARRGFGQLGAALSEAGEFARRFVTTLADSIPIIGGIVATVAGVGIGIATAGDKVREFEQRVNFLARDNNAFEVVKQSAENLGVSIGTVADTFGRFAAATRGLNITTGQINTLNETVFKLGRISGVSGQQLANVVTQVTQGLSGGLLGDELRSVRENLPLLAQILEDEFKDTGKTLKQLGQEGKLTGEVVANALIRAARETNKAFDRLPKTLAQSTARVKNEILLLLREIDEAIGSSKAFQRLFDQVALLARGIRLTIEEAGEGVTFLNSRERAAFESDIGLAPGSGEITRKNKRVDQDALDAAKKRNEAINKFLDSQDESIAKSQLQIDLIGKSPVEIALANLEFAKQNLLIEQGGKLSAEQQKRFEAISEGLAVVTSQLAKVDFDKVRQDTDKTIRSLQLQTSSIGKTTAEIIRLERSEELLALTKDKSRKATADQIAAFDAQTNELIRQAEAFDITRRGQEALLRSRGPLKEYQRALEGIAFAQKNLGLSAQEAARQQEDLRRAFLATQRDLKSGFEGGLLDIKDRFTDIASVVREEMVGAFQEAEDAIVKFVATGKFSVEDLIQSVQLSLTRIAVREGITAPLANAIGLNSNTPPAANQNTPPGGSAGGVLNTLQSFFGGNQGTSSTPEQAAACVGDTLDEICDEFADIDAFAVTEEIDGSLDSIAQAFKALEVNQSGGGGDGFDTAANVIGGIFGAFGGGGSAGGFTGGGFQISPENLNGDFARGGSFMVGPSNSRNIGGVDNRVVAFRARDGEEVEVRTPGQQRAAGGMSLNVHFHGIENGDDFRQNEDQIVTTIMGAAQRAAGRDKQR